MSDEVIIITPEIAPGSGGLADYTLRLVEQWRDAVRVRFLVPQKEGRDAEVIERNATALLSKLPTSGGKILLQYSAYGFDHFGYPRWLLRALKDWKRASGGLLVVMFHEIWTFWPVLNKNYLIQQLHRRDLRELVGAADAVFTSTASQGDHLRALAPGRDVRVLPVGSNIVPVRSDTVQREPGCAVLFGLQRSRLNALQKMSADLQRSAASRRLRKLVTVGGGNTADGARAELELLATFGLSDRFEQRGALAEDAVSALLSHASFGISAQDELSVTKSGTFMAYAAHGVSILSPFAGAQQPEPLCWATHPAEFAGGIADDVLAARAASLRAWQERTCSWPQIAREFAQALRLELKSTAAAPQQ